MMDLSIVPTLLGFVPDLPKFRQLFVDLEAHAAVKAIEKDQVLLTEVFTKENAFTPEQTVVLNFLTEACIFIYANRNHIQIDDNSYFFIRAAIKSYFFECIKTASITISQISEPDLANLTRLAGLFNARSLQFL